MARVVPKTRVVAKQKEVIVKQRKGGLVKAETVEENRRNDLLQKAIVLLKNPKMTASGAPKQWPKLSNKATGTVKE